jgi:hypothetical protein
MHHDDAAAISGGCREREGNDLRPEERPHKESGKRKTENGKRKTENGKRHRFGAVFFVGRLSKGGEVATKRRKGYNENILNLRF